MEDLVFETQFRRLPVADVTSDAVHSDDFPICVKDRAEALVHPDLGAVLACELDIDGRLDTARTHPPQPHVTRGVVDQAIDELRLGVELVRRVPGDREARRAHELETGIGEDPVAEYEVPRVLGEHVELAFDSSCLLLGFMAVRDVLHDAGERDRASTLVSDDVRR